MKYRRESGEQITGESWLVRNLWDVTTPSGGPRGLVSVPKKLKDTGVKSLIERALRAQSIRTKLEEGKKRFEFATNHGFRKFFKTRCEIAGMRSLTVEYLLNHSTGITDSDILQFTKEKRCITLIQRVIYVVILKGPMTTRTFYLIMVT